MNQDLVRLDRFDGSNFTRWQDKVRFLLTRLKIFYILDPTLAPLPNQRKMTHLKWWRQERRGRRMSSYISPYELWKGRKPNIGYFKVWGCLAYCKKTDPNKTKLGPRAIKCAFVGYASNSKAYRLLDLESNVIIESREVEFFENLLSDSNSQVPTSVGESLEETPSKVVEQPIVPRKSQRARKRKCWDRMRLTLKEFPFT
ncbi:hypothetical protein AAG906_015017 [Vitis piasezkii]